MFFNLINYSKLTPRLAAPASPLSLKKRGGKGFAKRNQGGECEQINSNTLQTFLN